MQFMLVLYEDPSLIATDSQRQAAVEKTGEYAMGLLADGILTGGAPLRPVSEARKLSARDGKTRVLDGPFAEAKEVIAGYFLIEADSTEHASKIAAGCPNVDFGSVEVREIVPMG